jgi:hypothetical protein
VIVETPVPIVETPVPIVETPVPIVETPAPIVETPVPQKRCPYGYNGIWASPIPVLVVKEILKEQRRATMKDVIKKYAKHGEKRITHEIAIEFLADKKKLTPEEFLKTVDPPPRCSRTYWAVSSNRGGFCLTGW